MLSANKKEDYPKSVKDMVDVMRQVKVSPCKKSADKDKSESKQKSSDVTTEKSFAQEKWDLILCNVCGKPGELASNCPMKLEFPMGKWFNKTGKTIERKPGKAKSNPQKTTKVSFQSKEESSDDSDNSDNSEEESSDDSDEESHTQVGWSWHHK